MGMPAKMLPTATPSSSAGSSEPTKKHASQSFPQDGSPARNSKDTARTIRPNSTSMTAR